MERVISGIFVVVGLIKLYPVIGVLGSNALTNLYGLPFDEANLLILMRHRAILLGLVGLFLLIAAVRRDWQPPAFVAGLVSMVSFVGIASADGALNSKLTIILAADVIAAILLGGAGLGRLLLNKRA
jgi:uncharacterized BrkB/YihY/UPF0761 family membrane protein